MKEEEEEMQPNNRQRMKSGADEKQDGRKKSETGERVKS